MNIATAGNTVVPAYLALLAKGYSVSREAPDKHAAEIWRAEARGNSFIAEDRVYLLGLVALLEVRGESWKANDAEIERFLATFPAS